ncbi:MAG: cytochrome c oxidase subunit 3 [Pseudobdellovibrionaceae bacterium]
MSKDHHDPMSMDVTYGTTGHPHPYHMVRPSLWPLVASMTAGLFAIAMVLFMHDVVAGKFLVPLGVLGILGVMFVWWRDVIHEAVVEKAHTPIAQIGLRYGMLLFIASEVMFFVAFFWAFFDASLFANEAQQYLRSEHTGSQWPPVGIEVIAPFGLPFLMTMILLLSGCTVTWAHYAIVKGNQAESVKALGITVMLGIVFLFFQVFEYHHAKFHFTDGIYPSTFFMATGFHGFHVLVGTIFLAVCWFRAMRGHFTPERHFGFEAAAWYWHFVDVVWLFLFVAIYFWGNVIGVN